MQLEKKLHSITTHSNFRLFLTMEINPKVGQTNQEGPVVHNKEKKFAVSILLSLVCNQHFKIAIWRNSKCEREINSLLVICIDDLLALQ